MADFLTTKGISFQLEKIITSAVDSLTIVSPYLKISQIFFDRLKEADSRGVTIRLIYGKDKLRAAQRRELAELENLEVFFFKDLHAKCYFNEELMIIGSMNFYEFSEANNREMGVLVSSYDDTDAFHEAAVEVNTLIQHGEKTELVKKKVVTPEKVKPKENTYYKYQRPKHGFCIRCRDEIPRSPDRPYCYSCFSTWASFGDVDYRDHYCILCGDNYPASMRNPVCSNYNKH